MDRSGKPDRRGRDFRREGAERAAREALHDLTDPEALESALMVDERMRGWFTAKERGEIAASDLVAMAEEAIEGWEHERPALRAWNEARAYIALCLAQQGHVRESAMMASMLTELDKAAALQQEVAALYVSREGIGSGATLTTMHLELVLHERLHRDDGSATGFVHAIRRHVMQRGPSVADESSYETIDRILSVIVPDYDPIADWMLTAEEVLPDAYWPELRPLADPTLWDDFEVPTRRIVLEVIARRQQELMDNLPVDSKAVKELKANIATLAKDAPELPIWDRLRLATALAIFSTDNALRGLEMTAAITDPAVRTNVAEGLLRAGRVNEARRVLTEQCEPGGAVAVILGGAWPNRQDSKKLLDDIAKLNKYPPEFRWGCMEALAALAQEAGDAAGAHDWQYRADLLRRQVARGIVRYKQPKR